MIRFEERLVEGVRVGVFVATEVNASGSAFDVRKAAHRRGITHELWDLRRADLTRWDYAAAKERLEHNRHTAHGVRAALLTQDREQFAVAAAIRALVEAEGIGSVVGVFTSEAEALCWLLDAPPPSLPETIPAPEPPGEG